MIDNVSKYIKENWKKTIRSKDELRGDIKINHPFMSPTIVDAFEDMYYWDTYWINLGLMEDNEFEQALNNIDNFSIFINKMGYMPNANVLLDRSQPPFYTKMVFDYYLKTNDINVIKKYVDTCIKEYQFWQTKRKGKYGLNIYSSNSDKEALLNYAYPLAISRVLEKETDDEEEQLILGKGLMVLAESGFDCNLRFRTNTRNCDALKFIPLDINCILYDVEIMISKMLKILNRDNESIYYLDAANNRKELINKYLYSKEKGMYLDYNFEDDCFSSIISVVSMYPYTFNISNNKDEALNVLKHLEYEYGVSTSEYRGDDIYLQWDYPCMWAPVAQLTYLALINVNAVEDAKRIASKYTNIVASIFNKTGKIWEKYDAVKGDVGVSVEYETPEMLGWSAGVYRYFIEKLKEN